MLCEFGIRILRETGDLKMKGECETFETAMPGRVLPPSVAGHECWEQIDAVVCINMDDQPERWAKFQERMAGVIPAEKLHRLSAVVGRQIAGYGERPWFTARTGERSRHWAHGAGCLLSHRDALRLARDKGWANVLIMEDDAVPEVTAEGMSALGKALRELRGKWLLYLGYVDPPTPSGARLWQQGPSSLWLLGGALALHAYMAPASMYDPLLAALPERHEDVWRWMAQHRAIDNFFRNEVVEWRGVRVYGLLPLMYYQEYFYARHAGGAVAEPGKTLRLSSRVVYPRTWGGLFRMLHCLGSPLRRLWYLLNSCRTYWLCRRAGFRGKTRGLKL